jgi:hypothetical protein
MSMVGNEIKGAYTALNSIGPEIMLFLMLFSAIAGVYSAAASLGRFSRISSKYILPEPPAIVVLP